MDINPTKDGHILVLPKEHQPILPLLPEGTFKHMFQRTRLFVKALKKAMLVPKVSVFIANGAVAGQQSPHFLFHVIPREQGDGLDNFSLQPNPALKADNDALRDSLQNNLSIMMQRFLSTQGKSSPQASPQKPAATTAPADSHQAEQQLQQ